MSGEDSKRSGEIGEKLAEAFLEMIGWHLSLQSVSITCNNNSHKTETANAKRTHGDDKVFIYNNPFYDSRTDIVHISVKNNLHGYSDSESDLKRKFKEHVEEINEIIACAQYDENLTNLLSGFKGRKHKEHSGLLIWTSSDNGSQNKDILSIVKNIRTLSEHCNKNVYFVDGARINFFLLATTHIKNEKNIRYEFFYPESGNIINKLDERHGLSLPLELIIADLLPIKVTKDNKELLYIYVNQSFEKDCYRRVLSLALDFAGAWPKEIRIGFPDYNAAHHKNDAIAAQLPFKDRQKEYIPFCFTPSNLNSL